ncbi:MAG TPA: RNase adapter RapZ [Firmicutes bacterium]|nr:RNase adapter RapZ [Bacillota bacterium]
MGGNLQFIIITGLSGAGKSEAVRCFEDMGFFCVDNLPPALIPKFAELCTQSAGKVKRVAIVSDIRGGDFFDSLFDALQTLENDGILYQIIYLEASNDCLIKRFKQTRRRHPMASEGSILEGIMAERRRLEGLRGRAHKIIDTSNLTTRQLHAELARTYGERESDRLTVTFISFGFKHGVPLDADMVFDVRFLPNPHYVESLQPLTGNHPDVVKYVMGWAVTKRFLAKVCDLLDFLLPQFVSEGKTHLIIGIGCTGGQHRSVMIANHLGKFVQHLGYNTRVDHRDIDEERPVLEPLASTQ